jgi:hypothetical protein
VEVGVELPRRGAGGLKLTAEVELLKELLVAAAERADGTQSRGLDESS